MSQGLKVLKLQPLSNYRSNINRISRYETSLQVDLNTMDSEKPLIIEIISDRSDTIYSSRSGTSYSTTYKEANEDVVTKVLDSPLSNVFTILFNPTTMLLALYFSSAGRVQITRMFRSIFNKKAVEAEINEEKKKIDDLPFQIYECEVNI